MPGHLPFEFCQASLKGLSTTSTLATGIYVAIRVDKEIFSDFRPVPSSVDTAQASRHFTGSGEGYMIYVKDLGSF